MPVAWWNWARNETFSRPPRIRIPAAFCAPCPTLKTDRTRPLQTIEGTVPALQSMPARLRLRASVRVARIPREVAIWHAIFSSPSVGYA